MSVPRFEPMLAVPWAAPFSDEGWMFEPKWDGVRVLASWSGSGATLRSRTGTDVTERYPEVSLRGAPQPAVIDGEIVALDSSGAPSFERLQGRMHLTGRSRVAAAAAAAPVTFVSFDLLYLGESLVAAPIEERRAALGDLAARAGIALSGEVVGDGEALWKAIEERGLEGIVAKRLGSRYRPGVRSADWRKIARVRHLRAVVGGSTPGSGSRAGGFGALVLGLWEGGRLRWIGNVGTGFSDAEVAAIGRVLADLAEPVPPFHPDPGLPPARWVKPRLVASIGYREWTAAGRLRHPRFRGFTDDSPEAVTWSVEGPGT